MLAKQEIRLSPLQQIKLELYREFGDDAKEAFDFVMADAVNNTHIQPTQNENKTSQDLADGVYIIYNDGRVEPYTGDNSKDDVRYVGVVFNHRRIAVALHDLGEDGKEYQFLKDGEKSPEHSVFYSREHLTNAFEDFAGAKNTRHLIEDYKSEIPFELLENGEYIPALGEWGVLMMNASRINEALEYVGGTPIRGWQWSSTENSQYGAWGVYFESGYVSNNGKCSSNSVRAVAAF